MNISNDGGVSLAPVTTMFPNSTIKTIDGGTFVAAEQYLNYNIQAKEHQAGMSDNLLTRVLRINLSPHHTSTSDSSTTCRPWRLPRCC